MGLQGLITAVAGVGTVVASAQALSAGQTWLTTAWTANGDAGKLKAASKAFLNMIGSIVAAVASAAGVRASGGKATGLTGLATRESLIAQVGSKSTYDSLMGMLKQQGVRKGNAQVLAGLLKKVPDPAELKTLLSSTADLALLEQVLATAVRIRVPVGDVVAMFEEHGPSLGRYLKRSPDSEIEAAIKGFRLERADGGHSLARHGPQVDDAALEARVTQGVAPDGKVSPASPSTRFRSFADWLETREEVLRRVIPDPHAGPGVNGNPASTNITKVTEFRSKGQLGEGYEGVGSKVPVRDPRGPKPNGQARPALKVFPLSQPVGPGLNRTRTTIEWVPDPTQPTRGRWDVVQHFPEGAGFNSSSRTYAAPADMVVP